MADIGTLNPEQMLQQQQILRQQRMAELLMNKPAPQGQMVGNRYVAPSWTQNLANLANIYVGKEGIEKADQAQLDLAKAIRNQESVALADYMSELQGKPATQKQTELAGPYGQAGDGANIPMPTATRDIAAVPANPMLANMNALQNPNSPAFLRTHAMGQLVKQPKWEKAEYTDEKTGKTRQGVIDVNSPNPISTFQVGGVKPEMTAYERASLGMRGAELADQGIGYGGFGGGQPSGALMSQPSGQPMGQAQGIPQGQAAGQQNAFAPSTLPKYQPDPSLSPRQNREQALKFSEKQQTNVTNAKDSFDLLKEASKILTSNEPSSGRASNILTGVGEAFNLPFGARKQESEADAKLKVLGGALTAKQPRFEGPQSNIDVAFYKQMAGDLDNPNLPIEARLETLKTMVGLQKKYFPSGEWDTISTTLNDAGKVSLGPKKEVDFNSLPSGRR
jgi:hypothetical protein